jgi:hypothetical protein
VLHAGHPRHVVHIHIRHVVHGVAMHLREDIASEKRRDGDTQRAREKLPANHDGFPVAANGREAQRVRS